MHLSPRNLILENGYIRLKNCRNGLMLYNINDTSIGRSLEFYGEWCQGELDLLKPYIKKNSLIIDAGANIGTHTLFFAAHAKKVLAFEPQRLPFQLLNGNLSLNRLTNVQTFQNALGSKKEILHIPFLSPEKETNFGANRLSAAGEEIAVLTIDSLELPRCDLIKIDVEGFELKVLKGAQATIKKFHPILFVENQPRNLPLERTLTKLGYTIAPFICPYFNPDNFFQNRANMFHTTEVSHNLLCL
jgi:FkbM family methyltransferase